MATVKTLIGNVKGPKGDTGKTGATGAAGAAATIEAGTADTVAYGQPAEVTNVGTNSAAIFNFKIPAGAPGTVGEISGYPVNAITTQQGNFPTPIVGETIAQIVGKQAKATTDAQTGIQTANTNIANILGDFGTVESAATASKAYEVGDYLVLNGQFYKVTAAIAQGNALVVDGNIEATNVGAEVASLNKDLSITFAAISTEGHTVVDNRAHAYKSGKIGFANLIITTTKAVAAYDTIAIIPYGYRPISVVYKGNFAINTTGAIQSMIPVNIGTTLRFSETYIIA